MATIKDYMDYAELAQASYVNGLNTGMYSSSYNILGKNILEIEFSTKQATNFANRYKVKAIANPYITGLDAVLFYDTYTNKYVLSIRGTASASDVFSDILLAKYGVAYDQHLALNDFYNKWVLDDIIPLGTKLDVTGHSLGGALAQTFAVANPDVVDNVYSYNAPGIGGLSAEAYETLGIISSNLGKKNVFNIYVKEGISVTSGLGTMLGTVTPVSIDEDSALGNHSMFRLTNSLHIYNMLSSITNTQDINLLTSILEKTTNEQAVSIVSDIFEYQVNGATTDEAIALSEKWSGDAEGIVSMVDKNISQLQSKSVENLYALINFNSFAIKGDYLPAYTNINPDNYSDIYVQKRAEFLYYSLDVENRYKPLGDNVSAYKDIELGVLLHNTTLSGKSYATDATTSRVIFGDSSEATPSTQSLQGARGDDFIFGGQGEDILIGSIGSDYLEGGDGKDTYLTGDGDTIQDSDGKGLIKFKDIDLTGTKVLKDGSTDVYVDQEDKSSTTPVFEYKKEDNNLVVTHLSSGESITILEWSKEKNLGIVLQKSEDIDINVGDASELEAAQEMQVSVEILRELDVGEVVDVEVGYYIPTYKVEYGAEVFVAAQEAYTYRPERQITTGEEFVGVGSITFTKEDEQTQELKNSKKGNKIA